GVLHYNHLMRGVAKGAFTEDEAKARFEKWLEEKEGKVTSKKDRLAKEKDDDSKKRLTHEAEVNAKKAEALAQKRRPAPETAEETEETTEVAETETPETPEAEGSEETTA